MLCSGALHHVVFLEPAAKLCPSYGLEHFVSCGPFLAPAQSESVPGAWWEAADGGAPRRLAEQGRLGWFWFHGAQVWFRGRVSSPSMRITALLSPRSTCSGLMGKSLFKETGRQISVVLSLHVPASHWHISL